MKSALQDEPLHDAGAYSPLRKKVETKLSVPSSRSRTARNSKRKEDGSDEIKEDQSMKREDNDRS